MKNTSKFQNVVIATIVGWLVLFVFLPNLMIIGTSFLTRDDASFVKMVFTLDNYTRLLDPLYFEVLLHSLNMALIATLACLVLGYPFLTTHTAHLYLPVLGDIHIASALFFDIGVFTLVVGSTMLILTAIAHQSIRSHRYHAKLQDELQEQDARDAAGAPEGLHPPFWMEENSEKMASKAYPASASSSQINSKPAGAP